MTTYALTPDESERFRLDGYLGRFALCSPEEMRIIRERIDRDVHPERAGARGSRHLDARLVYDLCAHPAIVGRIAGILGPDLMIWNSNFWMKEPGQMEFPYHQDGANWPLVPLITVSAWIAIDETTVENGCVHVIPGSQGIIVPRIPPRSASEPGGADPSYVDTARAVPMELRPGEFFLWSECTLHGSPPNYSQTRRLGLCVRMTVPFVKVDYGRLGYLATSAKSGCVMVSGTDKFGINLMRCSPG